MKVSRIAIIPARYASTRFPGKPLARLGGKPMVLHVVERVRSANLFDRIWVATDDDRIADVVVRAGGEAYMTRSDHASGTERVAELAQGLPPDTIVFNVQGDEPLLPPGLLAELMALLEQNPQVDFATAAHPANDPAAFSSPHVVKVVVGAAGTALYFSRAAIPYRRGAFADYLRHIGIYAFRRQVLSDFVALPPGRLEQLEGLEQLRALENGMAIHVLVTQHESIGVDTPEDLQAVARRVGSSSHSREAAPGLSGPSSSHARYVT